MTCRKIFKKRFVFFLFILICGIIFLSIFFSIKNRKLQEINMEMKDLKRLKDSIQDKLISLSADIEEEQFETNSKNINIDEIRQEIEMKKPEEEKLIEENKKIQEERDSLEKKSLSLSNQLKKEMELEEVYSEKIGSLNTLLSSLKKEYEKLRKNKNSEKIGDKTESVFSSLIINQEEKLNIEEVIGGTIQEKCFDGVQSYFSPKAFHSQCDGFPLLILIKTENSERIGAFTKISFKGKGIFNDPSSLLMNIDNNKYYPLYSPETRTIVCDPEHLAQFGEDLIISNNGKGFCNFPFDYGKNNINYSDEPLSQTEEFFIEEFEVFKVKFEN